MQYGLIQKNLKKSPLVKLFKQVPLETFHIRKVDTRWSLCPAKEGTFQFQISKSVFHTDRWLLYCLIIETKESKLLLRQVGTFTRRETALLALNQGTLQCRSFKMNKRFAQQRKEPDTHNACPVHLTETCHLKLSKNIESTRELRNGIEREYFVVHERKLEFASVAWWR
jgi:hypothetical protein